MNSYPKFSVSGVELNSAQCATIWAALQAFASEMKTNGLGEDAHGKFMAEAYQKRVDEINEICIPTAEQAIAEYKKQWAAPQW